MNDSELVDGLRQRRPAAVAHLMDFYVPSLWRCVYVRAHGDRHLTEDVVSEVVLALLKTVADRTVEIVCPMAWLRGVAFHKLQDYYRAAARVQHLIDQAGTIEPNDQSDPVAHHERTERRATIRKVMDGLDEQHRLVLEWKYIDGLSVREIARRFEVTEKAAESILFRARREFRQSMSGTEHDDEEEPEAGVKPRKPLTVSEPPAVVAQSGQDERVTQR